MSDVGSPEPIHRNVREAPERTADFAPAHAEVFVRPVLDHEIADGTALAECHLRAALAPEELLRSIHARNPDSLWGIFKPGPSADDPPIMIGFCAFLILNAKGASALLRRSFDPHQVSLDYIAPSAPSAQIVYIWGVLARGVALLSARMIHERLVAQYRGCPIYATAGTEAGLKTMIASGFIPASGEQSGVGALYRYMGTDPVPAAGLSPARRRRERLKIVPVSTAEEMEKALLIRHVFMTEQNCPYEEEFDGNDRTGTHFLGYVDGEPAATLRIRYFADFFKMERLAVLPRFRRTLIAKEIVLAAVNFCRRKGYRRGFGHAQKHLVPFWAKFGFKPTDRDCTLTFSDHDYVEMYGDLEPDERALTMESDPYVMLRPEGRWDEVCTLERSAARTSVNVP